MDLKIARKKYFAQRRQAKARNIPFLLNFIEWYNIWERSGKWEQRGRTVGCYVMARYGDQGPYSIDNVIIITQKQNSIDGNIGKIGPRNGAIVSEITKNKLRTTRKKQLPTMLGKTHTVDTKNKIREQKLNTPKLECPHCLKLVDPANAKRWHFYRCKKIK